ncbi:hypothetical protein [Alkalicoccus luteus]|uniref:Uncharacterized protein n=1 Tax=Alkalicoccus luteus TaxID=1237094 RepID=A0A969PQG6_9BACI|nr:hypothetical protein [Alkalicoccus luteus]NJP37513.1 hypothetical protein [Alkalicoccus luteus]
MLALGAFFIVAVIMAAGANLAATRVVKKRGIDEDGIASKGKNGQRPVFGIAWC